jgi:uncharacterized protein YndB with AHSA1/START domain
MPPAAQASLTPEPKNSTTHVHQIYIKAEPQAIWDAITDPDWNGRYGYRGVSHYELKAGGKFKCIANKEMQSYGLPEVIVDGEVIEVKPPFKLVQTYRFLFTDANKAEGFTRLTFEIEKTPGGFCRLTVTHDTTDAPLMAHATQSNFSTDGGGGWDWILSDIKTLLETGKTMS